MWACVMLPARRIRGAAQNKLQVARGAMSLPKRSACARIQCIEGAVGAELPYAARSVFLPSTHGGGGGRPIGDGECTNHLYNLYYAIWHLLSISRTSQGLNLVLTFRYLILLHSPPILNIRCTLPLTFENLLVCGPVLCYRLEESEVQPRTCSAAHLKHI